MSIRKKGQRWEVRVSIGGGRRVEQRLPVGATKEDAQQLEAAIRRRNIDTVAGRPIRRLIDEAINEWVSTSAKSLRSWDSSLRYRVGVVKEYTSGKYLDQLPEVAQAIRRDGLNSGAAAATINRHLAVLRRVGNLAERWGWTDKPLGRRVEMMGGEESRHVYLTIPQVKALAKQAGGVAGDAIIFAALTGLRRGELLRLTPAMIRDKVIVLDGRTKSGKPRTVPMPPEAARIASKRLPWELTVDELRNAFEDAREAAGLPTVRFHDLRHTYASWLIQDGASLRTVQELLGHTTPQITARYSHLADEHLRKAVAGLKVGK